MIPIMKSLICRSLIVALITLSFQTAQAGMIGADQVAANAPPDRAAVLSILSRADTAAQLRAQGIDPTMARERVAAMTDEEVQTLAATNIDTAPAGGMSTAAGVLVVALIAGLVWYFAFRK